MHTSRDHHSVWSLAVEVLVLAVGATLAGATVLVRARFWPYGPCPRCKRHRRGQGVGSTAKAWNRCGHKGCSGGEVIRRNSRVFKVWRDEDRARKRK